MNEFVQNLDRDLWAMIIVWDADEESVRNWKELLRISELSSSDCWLWDYLRGMHLVLEYIFYTSATRLAYSKISFYLLGCFEMMFCVRYCNSRRQNCKLVPQICMFNGVQCSFSPCWQYICGSYLWNIFILSDILWWATYCGNVIAAENCVWLHWRCMVFFM